MFDTYQDPNAKAMAFRRFKAEEGTRRRVRRAPRWRSEFGAQAAQWLIRQLAVTKVVVPDRRLRKEF